MSPLPSQTLPVPLLPYFASLNLPPPSIYPPSLFALLTSSTSTPTALTPIISKALSFARDFLPPWVLNHSLRVYAYGVALATHAGWTEDPEVVIHMGWDQELWFLAALFHDIGWAPDSECRCGGEDGTRLSFEIWGGMKARELLIEWGAPRWAADEVCEAIIRHTEDYNSGSLRLVTALLNLGPSHDFRAILHAPSLIHPETTSAITLLYPRLGLIYHFVEVTNHETETKPGCLSAIWAPRTLGKVGGIQDFDGVQGKLDEGEDGWERKKDGQFLVLK
ncbi:hypothetical protein JAAARDRAFT_662587 [Jaapia argillacea MUCL 33604]|uniref:HD domain-containing protein n=1 Tax=Jaapia argillacea MUCL 33604 TaxID=933084 RepID=A0A067P2S1_9AGAM|nr:hypothetical protein JAAARDRAFT_662587 [Jaapia argillacea MUCL 33604]